jgi:hypothetical protein
MMRITSSTLRWGGIISQSDPGTHRRRRLYPREEEKENKKGVILPGKEIAGSRRAGESVHVSSGLRGKNDNVENDEKDDDRLGPANNTC